MTLKLKTQWDSTLATFTFLWNRNQESRSLNKMLQDKKCDADIFATNAPVVHDMGKGCTALTKLDMEPTQHKLNVTPRSSSYL